MKELSAIKKAIRDLDGQIAPAEFTEEELTSYDEIEEGDDRTYPIESTDAYNVNFNDIGSNSEFSYFEDAKQRTLQIAYLTIKKGGVARIIPVHYFAIGAVILKRNSRKLSVWNKPVIQTGIVLHKKLIDANDKIAQIELAGVKILDTSNYENEETGVSDYYKHKQWALQAVKKERLRLEQELINNWCQEIEGDSFLIVDGTIMNFRGNEDNSKRCIGISKGTRMKMDNQEKVMQLRENQRSWTFSFHDENDNRSVGVRDRISWYLRLREKSNSFPEFGLIRSEMHFSHRNNASALADRFSKSLLIERLPTCHPENNWDKTLYPIALCENYLSSIMPSLRAIKSSMKL